MDKTLHINYQPAQESNWTGRVSNPELDNQYWYQEIILSDLDDIGQEKIDFGLIGYACDEGVSRNLGRPGAQQGPTVLRERLSKIPIHFKQKKVADFGDLICKENDMEACQDALARTIEALISNSIFPIAIGGGHDIAYGHFKGIYNALNRNADKKIGIINFDAHFDLRPVEDKPNSGTPFNQILNEFDGVSYFAVGIQQQANTKELFDIAQKHYVPYALHDECESDEKAVEALKAKLQPFIDSNNYLYITVDLDGFSSAYAPGVSAPSPLGFDPAFFFKILSYLLSSSKVKSVDLAELNPSLDRDNQTATLAARIVDFVVENA
ncbi:formimidoylglutamase [Nonlabens antarcticus]|uniref:formimidoylglutamase n=1 Tax=Nonlabens antarcticus TaxID=392714 RepID=UPI00189104A5|nr:formimidoylglutamase [Nonlabens antarcticus]